MNNGDYTTNFFPEGNQILQPQKMKTCGQAFNATQHDKDNRNGRPISAAFVEFINLGQTLVFLDDNIPIRPAGGYYSIKNPCFNAKWKFYAINNPPTPDSKFVFAGNKLIIVVHYNHDSLARLVAPDVATSGAGGNVTLDLINTTVGQFGDLTTANFAIPVNAVSWSIRNVGGAAPNTITYNGIPLAVGGYRERLQRMDGVYRFIYPQIDVVTNGSQVEYYYETNPLI